MKLQEFCTQHELQTGTKDTCFWDKIIRNPFIPNILNNIKLILATKQIWNISLKRAWRLNETAKPNKFKERNKVLIKSLIKPFNIIFNITNKKVSSRLLSQKSQYTKMTYLPNIVLIIKEWALTECTKYNEYLVQVHK